MDCSLSEVLLRFQPPGFALNDARLVVHLDSAMVFDGPFRAGFDYRVTVAPGRHRVDARIVIASVTPRTRTWYFDVGVDEQCLAALDYSRMSGNFGTSLGIRRSPLR